MIGWWQENRPLPNHRNTPQLGKSGVFLVNHLPRRHIAYPPITVPWSGCEYAGVAGQFLEYPELMGFDLDALQNGSFGVHSQEEGLAFLQAWLFFGLLQEMFAEKSDVIYKWWVEDWDDPEISPKNMKSPFLTKYLDVIAERLADRLGTDRPPFEYWKAIFELTVTVVEAFEQTFLSQGTDNTTEEPVPLRITWSILMLGQILSAVVMKCYNVEDTNIKHWPDGTLLHRRIRQRRWCPHLANKLMTLLSMENIYLLTLMSWYNPVSRFSALPDVEVTDRLLDFKVGLDDPTMGVGRHRLCTSGKCLAEKIDEQSYRTEHVHQQCNCKFIGPDVSEVIRILDAKEVPVFLVCQQLDQQGALNISVDVERSSSVSGYVAMSHVWADGLGNKASNTLPICQAIRVAHLVHELAGAEHPPFFWIDTFGIPRELEQRKKALAVMNDTYRLSKHVLVLDGGLQNFTCYRQLDISLEDIDVEIAEQIRVSIAVELLLRILCCSWTSRLWTLPEGMLGSALHFQFFDGTVELGDLYAQLKTWPFIGTNLINDLRSSFIRLRPKLRSQSRRGLSPEDPALLNWPSGSLAGRFISMFSCLEWRDTTWQEDEATCLGIHLGLNMDMILSQPYEHRLEAFFAQLDEIPTDLMFTHGPRMLNRPYRWAPLHLLEFKDNYLCIPAAHSKTPMARRTNRGLVVKCKSFQLATRNERPPDARFIYFTTIATDANGRAMLRRDLPFEEQQTHFGMMLATTDPRTACSWRESNTHALLEGVSADASDDSASNLYVLVGPECMQGPPANMGQGKICLVVKREDKKENNVICGAPLDTVVVYKMPGHASVKPDLENSQSFVHWQGIEVDERTFLIG